MAEQNRDQNKDRKKKKKSKKSRRAKVIKARIISILIAIVLIIIVGFVAILSQVKSVEGEDGEEVSFADRVSMRYGDKFNFKFIRAVIYPDKYAYSIDKADLNEYFSLVNSDDVAIILQDELIENKGKIIDGKVYFSLDTVSSLFTKRFYYNDIEKVLLYTTSDSIRKVDLSANNKGYYNNELFVDTDYVPAVVQGDMVYVCADYIKLYCNYSYDYYSDPNRVQVYTSFGTRKEAELVRKNRIRFQGGIKSEVLTSVEKGDKVTVLEKMENWTKVKTKDCFIGYIENDKLSEVQEVTDTAPTGAYVPKEDYLKVENNETIVLGWHQILYADDGSNLNSILSDAAGINVVSPTVFFTNSSSGTFENNATKAYVDNAHNKGLKVWLLCDDFTKEFDEFELFSSSVNRKAFIDNLINATLEVGADGINIDFEKVGKQTGPHFVQFLRELSIETRKNGLVLSVDDYHPNQGNTFFNLGEQGLVCDYVIIMNYDEHWAGCEEAGSVASIGYVESGLSDAIKAGVPPYKLINATPFYMRLWRHEGDNLTSSALGMDDAQNWVDSHGLTPGFDETTCQYYVTKKDGTAEYEMWMEEKASIEAKMAVCANYNITGIACWRLGLENDSVWPVIANYFAIAGK